MKRKIKIKIYPDNSGGEIMFDLISNQKFLRTFVDFPSMNIGVIDRHTKARFWDKYAGHCDRFKKCNLSIANYEYTWKKNLQDTGIDWLWKTMEKVWEEDR